MKINIKATKTTLTPAIKSAVEKKLHILERFLRPENTVYVELEVDKKHKTGLVFRSEIKITPHGFFAEARGADIYAALDLTLPKIKEQIIKRKDKKITKSRDVAKKVARIKKGMQNA